MENVHSYVKKYESMSNNDKNPESNAEHYKRKIFLNHKIIINRIIKSNTHRRFWNIYYSSHVPVITEIIACEIFSMWNNQSYFIYPVNG